MREAAITKVAMIGCGAMAQNHILSMLQQLDTTEIVIICEPNQQAYDEVCSIFSEAGLSPPPNQPDLQSLLREYKTLVDAAFILTPHVFHFEQAKSCLEGGLDVLLEKPMVITASEARELIRLRDSTGRLLVIAFNGSLSPRIREASRFIDSGKAGKILAINSMVWEDWSEHYVGHWKQKREISGGGFMFDTGSHMLNTLSDLVGEPFTEVTAWLDNRNKPVDIVGTVMARTKSGVLLTMTACGASIPSIGSEIKIFGTDATIRTGIWGEFLEIQKRGDESMVNIEVSPSLGVWDQFLAVRSGNIDNPSPPEIGLRMATLWDAIQASAALDGAIIRMDDVATADYSGNRGESKDG